MAAPALAVSAYARRRSPPGHRANGPIVQQLRTLLTASSRVARPVSSTPNTSPSSLATVVIDAPDTRPISSFGSHRRGDLLRDLLQDRVRACPAERALCGGEMIEVDERDNPVCVAGRRCDRPIDHCLGSANRAGRPVTGSR